MDNKSALSGLKSWLPVLLMGVSLVGWSVRLEAQGQKNTEDIRKIHEKLDVAVLDINQSKADSIRLQGSFDLLRSMISGIEKSVERIERSLEAERNRK